jgi:transmembrane sensor
MKALVDERDTTSWTRMNEEAAHWHARLDAGLADEDAFEEWRAADPRHAAAFARIAAAASVVDDIGPVDLSNDPDFAEPPLMSRRRWMQLAAAGTVLAIGGGAWFKLTGPAKAETAVGEHKTLELIEGITLDLNTDSAVRWKLFPESNEIWLERGEVGLRVSSPKVPCLLHAAGQTITIRRGDINARVQGEAINLTVLNGDCEVVRYINLRSPPPVTPVSSGQSALLTKGQPRVRESTLAEQEFTAGWRNDLLVFDGQTLGVAVEEYNRYLTQKMIIVDSDLASIRLGGRFKSRDPKVFLDTLQASFGIHVATNERGAILLSR